MNPDHTLGDIAPLMASLGKLRQKIVLYGAGACGGYVLRHLRAKGIEPLAIVDSDSSKWGTTMSKSTMRDGIEGIEIISPDVAKVLYLDAEWVACAISRPAAPEIRAQLKAMGGKTKPLWEVLPVCHGLPPKGTQKTIADLLDDEQSLLEWCRQYEFRKNPDYDAQLPPSDIKEIYFPDFITHRDDEHFLDAGGGDGDTIKAFIERWTNYSQITAFEPDEENMAKLRESTSTNSRVLRFDKALSDHMHEEFFTANGDYSSHLGEGQHRIQCWKLDDIYAESSRPPTYIKMDIESAEPEALWGARRILAEHKPVLAICAYHKSEHLWSIPLLIHALQPEYSLRLRRYAEGAFELVWYAVPPERVK